MRIKHPVPSSWIRNRITPELRVAIADEGPGEARFGLPVGKPRGWVSCSVTDGERSGSGVGADPTRAFDAAIQDMRTPIVSVLR